MDMQNLMQQAQKMQQKLQEDMEEAERELAETTMTGNAGGELVQITVNGNKEIIRVEIDESVVDPDDVETLEDLIFAALKSAMDRADEKREDIMGDVQQGIDMPGMPNLPGMGG